MKVNTVPQTPIDIVVSITTGRTAEIVTSFNLRNN